MKIAEDWRPSPGEEDVRGICVGAQKRRLAPPVESDPFGDGIAFAGEANGRGEQLGERKPAVTRVKARPGIDGARHRHRMRRLARDLRQAVIA